MEALCFGGALGEGGMMRASKTDFYAGYVIGVLIAWAIFSHLNSEDRLIRECQNTTGAYECVMRAVPVAQPSWVSNGESE